MRSQASLKAISQLSCTISEQSPPLGWGCQMSAVRLSGLVLFSSSSADIHGSRPSDFWLPAQRAVMAGRGATWGNSQLLSEPDSQHHQQWFWLLFLFCFACLVNTGLFSFLMVERGAWIGKLCVAVRWGGSDVSTWGQESRRRECSTSSTCGSMGQCCTPQVFLQGAADCGVLHLWQLSTSRRAVCLFYCPVYLRSRIPHVGVSSLPSHCR